MTKEKKDTELTLGGSDVIQFSNALELAIGNGSNQSVGKDVMWWAGWQLGQLRPHVRAYQETMDHPRIRAMTDARRRLKDAFDPSEFEDALGMIEAANKAEHTVNVRIPSKDIFSDDVSIVFAKALSFLDID